MKSEGDLRVRLTKKLLVNAFLRLRREKPLRKITVSELCTLAGVGRGTFYAYYQDVYDLNETLEDEFLQQFAEALHGALDGGERAQSARRVCRTVFALLEENEPLCQLLLSSDNAGGAMRFVELGGRLFAEYYEDAFGSVPPERVHAFYRFVSSGCVACFKERLRSAQRPPVTQFADEMAEFISKGLRSLL